ncbi:MAG: hypothetical protein M9916_05105 [Crocinitomicaceae bacterium]|nr:hypothetical protein [Crocinitomicaceae bacterium]
MKSKKVNFSKIAFAMMITTLPLVSCKKEGCTDVNAANYSEKAKKDDGSCTYNIAGELVGSISGTKTLDASISYLITGPVIVEEGAVLNIPAGTTIKAKKGFNNYILVLQGGKINVNGTAEKPVRITADISNAQPGHWGGLIINGRAPLAGGTIGSTEISSAHQYGGTDPNDNSGSITHLILEYTGARSSADVEHNGLTLNGVGNGTIIENIYIPNGADDGVELFGGTVNIKNIFVVNSDDDMFDFTQGYTGTIENAYGIWEAGYTSTESDPRGIEADGNLDGNFPSQTGQSNFIVKNLTIDLKITVATDGDASNVTNKMQDAIKIRRGAKINVINALIKGSGTVIDLIDFTDGKGTGDAGSTISLTNSLNNTILGKLVNPTTGFPDAKIETGNTGCPSNLFHWTNYNF